MMAATCLWLLGLVLGLALALHPEEDFAFDTPETEQELPTPPHPTSAPIRRLWGVPDSVIAVGNLFRLVIPSDAFSGNINHYEAHGQGGGTLPPWLLFDKTSGIFEGVPSVRDLGEHYITVRAIGQNAQDSAKDVFSIEVSERTGTETALAVDPVRIPNKVKCDPGEDPTLLSILMDMKYEQLKPRQRVLAIKNLAGFLALHYSLFTLQGHSSKDDLLSDAVVLAGPGNIKKKLIKQSTIIQWQVGCDGRLWKPHSMLAHQLKQQARDGTLAEVLQQPVIGWHVKTEASTMHRERREVGSGDFVDDDEVVYDYDEDSESEAVPDSRIVPTMSSPVFPEATDSHPHRHHHGEGVELGTNLDTVSNMAAATATYRLPTSPVLYGTILPTPVLVPVRPTRLMSSEMLVEASRVYKDYAEVSPSATPVFITEVESSATTDIPSSQVTEPLPTSSSSSSGSTGGSSPSSTDGTSTTEEETTPMPLITERATTPRPTEEVEYDTKNIQPTIEHRLPKLPITAGKAFRYRIPEEAFSDLEDGNTRNLRLIFKTSEGTSVPPTSWVQFNPEKQEVYALPLEEQISKWDYILEAMDKEGKSVSDTLALQVQQHKSRRAVNHEFSLHLRIERKFDFPSAVDWQLQILDGLAQLYGNSDSNQITVLAINATSDPIVFTWFNDSLPRGHCPKESIDRLFKVLVANKDGDPSPALREILSPSLRVKKVTYVGLGQCDRPTKPEVPLPPPPNPTENFPPVPRNQVDHINATVGELLLFIVPEDSFYDPEDGSARNLKLSLLTMDRSPISPSNWLQFDVKNQEFYGIPMRGDEGRKEYQLVCEDKGGLTANDGLVVVVHPAAKAKFNVEFSMNLNIDYESFVFSASMKRKFIDKLRELFGDKNSSAIVVKGINEGSTIVTWYNRSLPTNVCPEAEISQLRRVLVNRDESISDRVNMVMGPDFPVQRISLTPVSLCHGELTELHTTDGPPTPIEDLQPVSSSDDYLVTFVVPAVIIVAMLLLAGIVACVLYRRRRTGKMSVGDEDERQSFRNKGIPVIFQDELEERPDPGNKSPVIMKEEKPPLPPPEYQRGDLEHATPPPTASHPLLGDPTSEDPPYQPPPPFTSSRDSGRQNRPKPTPTYRKPPPYVPP